MKLTHMLSRFFLNHILSNEDKITVKPQILSALDLNMNLPA